MNKSGFPIVYYRMPDEKNAWVIQSEQDAVEIDSLMNVPGKTGFILHPFGIDSSCKCLFIRANRVVKLTIEEVRSNTLTWKINASSAGNSFNKLKEEYCKNVADAVEKIRSGELQKVVLSRVKTIKNNASNPLKVFYKLCAKYPDAFVSLVYIPGNILWVTATPELLVSTHKNEIKTVSIAGTKPLENMEEWDEKEKMEQLVVTDYINETLKKYCSNITVSGPQEVIAGNVKHLKTSFSAELNNDLWNLVSALHPTPAVCGIPMNEATQFIKQTEDYNRKYYTGFLGPCNMDGKTDLFVNLRCAEVLTDAVNLYIGGGITKDSIPEKEWEETELKSKTLLFAFEENEKE